MSSSQRSRMPRWLLAVGAVAVLAVAGVVAWSVWPRPVPPHARQYLSVSACLLTDQAGIVAGSPAAPVWAAMESASLSTHVMVSYLPATGPSDVTPMLNTLVQRNCGVIIATGAASSQILAAGKSNPRQRFLLVAAPGTAVAAASSNTVVVSQADAVGRIGQVIRSLAASAPPAGS
jgi:basic membrane lipoprotein Med (substrate-binding protein (PBP1-ABC) superfamily)